MIKALIFDLDGVLVDTKIIHFKSLNQALKKIEGIEISFEDHTNIYDGLPTIEKLKILEKKKFINKKNFKKIKILKNQYCNELLNKEIKFSKSTYNLLKKLHKKYYISIATNAVKETVKKCIKILKISKYVNCVFSNEDVKNTKPHPEIYLRSILKLEISPKETLILEDSSNGRRAAKDSGAYLMPIKNLKDVNFKNIDNKIKELEMKNKTNIPWIDKELNILIPMAGKGSRFAKAGYTFPKPLIEINQKPMIEWVLNSLNLEGNYIFIIQKEHQKKYNIKSLLKILKPNCKIIELDHVTEGAACTTLLAKKYINNDKPLIISNSDQYIKWDSNKIMYDFVTRKYDGGILTFNAHHPKWSYAKVNNEKLVEKVAEKEVISSNATTGVYYWKKGSDYVKYALRMIKKNIRVNNEFYVCPVYNEAIKKKKKITISKVDQMHGLGTPEDVDIFIDIRKGK